MKEKPGSNLSNGYTERGLIASRYHLPYNPKLVDRARELRQHMTRAEKILWNKFLRDFPLRVLRQRPIHHYIVDFYCPKLKLVIEIDGEQHYTSEGKNYDDERSKVLMAFGLTIIRFTNQEIEHNLDLVCARINAFFSSKCQPNE